jgi:EAL domain-containing protein (putative c-di-GMP-specific phosphodiesterase class I)
VDSSLVPRRQAIEQVIAERRFQLVYQPIVHLDTGDVLGVEALCRFADGRSPERWFRDAEALGLAPALDLAIIETAMADVPALPPGYLSLNVSPSTLLDPRLLDLLGSRRVPSERLVVEITEHARVANYGLARRTIDTLRRLGVHIAVDDAGAGYATFRHVLRLRPDIIKMDHSITQHINEDPARMALAAALVIFAGEIGAVLVAEGVETPGELAALQRAGVSRAQGFALGRPQSLPLALPRASATSRDGEVAGEVATAPVEYDGSVVTTAHALLSPVGGIDLALELLRKKTADSDEDERAALIGTAQRQVRLVGSTLQDMMRGGPPALLVLDEVDAPQPSSPEPCA